MILVIGDPGCVSQGLDLLEDKGRHAVSQVHYRPWKYASQAGLQNKGIIYLPPAPAHNIDWENPREYPMLDFLTDRGIAELSFWWAGVAMLATVVVILYARA
jgi:hypothetical protein